MKYMGWGTVMHVWIGRITCKPAHIFRSLLLNKYIFDTVTRICGRSSLKSTKINLKLINLVAVCLSVNFGETEAASLLS